MSTLDQLTGRERVSKSTSSALAGRNEVIDAFRGFAILSVIAYHYFFAWQVGLHEPKASAWLQLGSYGVQIFFVISGLVITMTLLRSHSALAFGIRRAARLVPAFWVSNVIIFCVLSLYDPLGFKVSFRDFLCNLVFVPVELGRNYVDGAFWSLNIEVKFYAMVALCYLFLKERFWIGAAGFTFLGLLADAITGAGQRMIFLGPYMPFFMAGLTLWYAVLAKQKLPAAVCGATAIVCYVCRIHYYELPGVPLWAPHAYLLGGTGLIFALMRFAPETPFGPLAWLGRVSYSLYLVHQRMGVTLIALLLFAGVTGLAAHAAAIVCAVLLSWFLFEQVELPAQKYILRKCKTYLSPAGTGREAERKPRVICLWGKKRRRSRYETSTPSNTDKGTRELVKRGYDAVSIDVSSVYGPVRKFAPNKIAVFVAYGYGLIRVLSAAWRANSVVYTSNYPWIRLISRLKRWRLIGNRLVVRWTANDIDYDRLLGDANVRAKFARIMSEVDACWLSSRRERDIWRRALPQFASRVAFWPTPMDVEYYRKYLSGAGAQESGCVVAVGSDGKRDWDLPVKMAQTGVPVILLTDDRRVWPALGNGPADERCKVMFNVGFEESAKVLASASVILLSTCPNDRFSGATTVGLAAALAKPLMLDEPYDLAAYGLADGVNCVRFNRSDASAAAAAAKELLADKERRVRLGNALNLLAGEFSMERYADVLERSLKPGWDAASVRWSGELP